jgi:hypothetical protein
VGQGAELSTAAMRLCKSGGGVQPVSRAQITTAPKARRMGRADGGWKRDCAGLRIKLGCAGLRMTGTLKGQNHRDLILHAAAEQCVTAAKPARKGLKVRRKQGAWQVFAFRLRRCTLGS